MATVGSSALSPSLANSVLGNSSTSGSGTSSKLLKDDFLKLLTTQMRYQNPLEPTNNADFVAQLAQFSSLEGIQQLNTNFSDMMLLQGMTQGANMIGKTVTYDKTDSTVPGRGTVSAVQVNNGKLQLIVDNKPVAMSQVRSVEKSA